MQKQDHAACVHNMTAKNPKEQGDKSRKVSRPRISLAFYVHLFLFLYAVHRTQNTLQTRAQDREDVTVQRGGRLRGSDRKDERDKGQQDEHGAFWE